MPGDTEAKILVVDDDRVTTSWLRALLEPEGHKVAIASSGSEALDRIKADPPALIVLELGLLDTDGFELCKTLRRMPESANAWIILLSSKSSREDIAAGLGAGADDYIPKRRGADSELLAKSKMLLSRRRTGSKPAEDAGRGYITCFFSAKGGSGTTTLAVNTAYAIPALSPKTSTLLVDMVFPLGAVGHMIGSESTETIAKLTRDPHIALDRTIVARHISSAGRYGFSFLLSATDLEEAQSLEVDRIVPLFGTLRSMFRLIVVDLGHSLSRVTFPILETSDLIYIIVIPDITGLALTKLSLHYLMSRGIPRERLVLIQNRTVLRSWLSKESIEKELGIPIEVTIPYDGEQVPLATNAHVPYLEQYGNTSTAVTMRELGRLAVQRLLTAEQPMPAQPA
jgi:pilus assembly protein CpaE